MKNKKQTLITGAIVLAIILVVSLGTYAFITWSSSNINIAGTADCFKVKYIKGEDIGSDNNPAEFTLANDYTEGLSSSLSVYLKSSCSIAGGDGTLYLNIDLDATSEMLLGSGILKYQVLDGTTEVSNGIVGNNSSQAIYDNISITREEKTITIYLWIDGSKVDNNNINEILTSNFKGNISLKVESNETYNTNIVFDLSEQTLNRLNALNSSIKVDTSKTPDFSKISGVSGIDDDTGETVAGDGTLGIYEADDDDGTSYYFRGAVENNYVVFGGFVWRIVRINGDGSVRMIYYGKDNGDGTYDIDYAIGTSAYNENYDDNAYVGYMYGTAGSSTYEATHSNTNNSTIKTYVDNWYNNNLASYEEYIQSTTYCNDRSITPVEDFDGDVLTGNGIGTSNTAYSGLTRNHINSPATPSLKCTNANDRLALKIGLITSDEVVLAGDKGVYVEPFSATINEDFYLYYETEAYWTMTPNYFAGGLAGVGFVYFGFLDNSDVSRTYGSVRPVVSLKSDAISGGQGTYTDPFTIG